MLNQVKGPSSSSQVPKSGKWPFALLPASFPGSGTLGGSAGLDRCSQPGDPGSTSLTETGLEFTRLLD